MGRTPSIRVLLTEDVAADAELEVRELKRAGLLVTHRIVQTEESFERALREFSPDVILSDFSMPGFDGMVALALARELAPDTPFVFVSGTIGEEYAIRALKNGATDYVLKSNLLRLPAAVERALAEARERREKRRAEAELEIARERLTSIFTALPDMLWSVDAHSGRILYVSPAASELFGRSADEFLSDETLRLEVVHPDDRPRVIAAWNALRRGAPFELEYRALHPDGEVRWINNRGRLIPGPQGGAERIDGLARDVTEQVEQRRKLARLQRIRDLAGALNAAIVRIRDRRELFDAFCRIAVQQGGFRAAHLFEREPVSGVLRVAVSTDRDSGASRTDTDAMVADAARTRRAVVANEPTAGHSAACLPYLAGGEVAGAVVLEATERNFFDEEELRLLQELTGNLSFALELMDKQEQLAYLALYDPLTGLPNRTLFHERLSQTIEAARRLGSPAALVLIDLERFKAINDAFGQQTGDRVLRAVAQRVQQSAGDINRVARLGSNLFAVVLPVVSGAEEVALQLEQTGMEFFGPPFDIEGRDIRLAAKTGVAIYPEDGADAGMLFRNAEAALKRAKETGERYMFYTPHINARVSELVELENQLRTAVAQSEFYLHFQPKFELATRRMVGMEALVRWNAPGGKAMPPAKFIPLLEQTGLILEAGQQVIAAAARAYRDWRARGLSPPRIAVNISAIQLRRKSFVNDVLSALGGDTTEGGGIDLEVTESLLMAEVEESIGKLRALRDAGLHIALDDFGTGYSSLFYLSRLPIDTLKIDRSFVRAMTENLQDKTIISTIISLAQALRLGVVAEGVETEQQAELLRLLRCDQAQGYLFSPPVPAERIEGMLKAL